MPILTSIGAALAAGVAVFWGFYKFFDFIEQNASDEIKKPISEWLAQVKIRNAAAVVSVNVAYAFESFFGARQLSWRCVWRVVAFSALAMAISLIVVGGWKPLFTTVETVCREAWQRDPLKDPCPPGQFCFNSFPRSCQSFDVTGVAAKKLLTFFVLINVPIDFIAVGVTRWLLFRLRHFQLSWKKSVLFLSFDVATKCILIVIGIYIISDVQHMLNPDPCAHAEGLCFGFGGPAWDYVIGLLTGTGLEGPIARSSFLAMLLCSLWIWLYNLGLLAFGSAKSDTAIDRLRRSLNIRDHPIRSIGLIASFFSAVATVLLLLLMQLQTGISST
jgi:hypothetical protein